MAPEKRAGYREIVGDPDHFHTKLVARCRWYEYVIQEVNCTRALMVSPARHGVACGLLLLAHPVALLLLAPRQPLLARPFRQQPLLVRRTSPLLQAESPKGESDESSKGELVPSGDVVATGETRILTAADEEAVGNLVEDEEWLGLGTEMFIVLRSSLRESLKKNTRDFTGSDECEQESRSNRVPLAA